MTKLTDQNQVLEEIYSKIRDQVVFSVNIKQALKITQRSLKKFPKDFKLQYYEAVLIGDSNKGKSEKQIRQNHKIAAGKLKKILKRLSGHPVEVRASIRNEYYWFSRQPLKQYKLGVHLVKKGLRQSYYSQGVGAVMLSLDKIKTNKPVQALKWAKIAERCWKKYFKINPDYYSAHTWYARALGVQQRFDEMESELRLAADLVMKPYDFYEFEEVRIESKKLMTNRI